MTITQSAIVMVFGALLAGAGIVLLLLRKEQAENRIKVLGQEFQISTPALVVFLAGCGVFILPFVFPSQNPSVISIPLPWGKGTPTDTVAGAVVTTEEKEPNDQITAANLITMGSTVKGLINSNRDRDFFKFKTSSEQKVRVILRKTLPGGFGAAVTVYDDVESKVAGDLVLGEDAVSFAFQANPDSYYYVLVELFSGAPGPYELVVRRENR